MTRIFLTGATGYIGGDFLHALTSANIPSIQLVCLVRNSTKAAAVRQRYPAVEVVEGDLENTELIEEQVQKAEAVFHLAATGHIPSSTAIAKGLSNAERKSPGYWIQISGATLFAGDEIARGDFGNPPTKTYDDIASAEETRAIIARSPKRVVDNLVISQDPAKIKTMLVVGPLIYGAGRGPGNQRTVQATEIAKVTLENGKGFRLGEGKNVWSNVHVEDLSVLFLKVVEGLVEGKKGCWNEEGLVFPASGKMSFGHLSQAITSEANAQGHISSEHIDWTITAGEADRLSSHGSVLWGTNAVLSASRAEKALGWHPVKPTLTEEIPRIVRSEAAALGKLQSV